METAVNHIKLVRGCCMHARMLTSQRVERSSATAVLRALLTAIFFHRRLDNVEPETVDILETHVAAAVDREIDREVAAKVDEFAQTFVEAGCDSGEVSHIFLSREQPIFLNRPPSLPLRPNIQHCSPVLSSLRP